MTNLEFFLHNGLSIDNKAEEITIVGDKVEENLFDSKNILTEYLDRFVNIMDDIFDISIDTEKLQQFSFQAADGITYHEHKFMAVYSGGVVDCHYTNVNVVHPHDDYCINYFLESLEQVPKFYDLDIDRHTQPKLPSNATLISHWGQGVSNNTSIKDVYFMHSDVKLVSDFLGLPKPNVATISTFIEDTTFQKVFGLTYDSTDLTPLKLKLYYYPSDPLMEYTVFDETK